MYELVITVNCYGYVLVHRVRFIHFYDAKAQQNTIMGLLKKLVDNEVIESVGTTINNMTEWPG